MTRSADSVKNFVKTLNDRCIAIFPKNVPFDAPTQRTPCEYRNRSWYLHTNGVTHWIAFWMTMVWVYVHSDFLLAQWANTQATYNAIALTALQGYPRSLISAPIKTVA